MALDGSVIKSISDWKEEYPPLYITGHIDNRLLFGNSEKMGAIGKTIEQIQGVDVPVLIVGESGTGKELVANDVHLRSSRRNGPVVKVNCVAIPGELLESELFGYERGAFTGAYSNKPGRLEFAHNGTLFLDEIGDMPLSLQSKLLRVLQEGSFFRLGGNEEIKVDIRIIASTNKDLEAAIIERTFREDLYYRLNVIKLHIPPLRERKEEVPILISYFLGKYRRAYNKKIKNLPDKTFNLLMDYSWPGNVRELENIIKKYVVLEGEEIILRELNVKETKNRKEKNDDVNLHDVYKGLSLREIGKKAASQAEKVAIKKILEQTHWNRRQAAEILQISYKTLLSKIKETGLDRV
ncbi:MAG: sigma-54 dependent transcriptional regulator [Thermodesulfobacteriota bacterium]|nr:sigma-54 dependent transcriptional regulator [Thermodesulfobacteriota bacterium]